eukprot:1085871-Pleurochrysis_carterae.AAC.1
MGSAGYEQGGGEVKGGGLERGAHTGLREALRTVLCDSVRGEVRAGESAGSLSFRKYLPAVKLACTHAGAYANAQACTHA